MRAIVKLVSSFRRLVFLKKKRVAIWLNGQEKKYKQYLIIFKPPLIKENKRKIGMSGQTVLLKMRLILSIITVSSGAKKISSIGLRTPWHHGQ